MLHVYFLLSLLYFSCKSEETTSSSKQQNLNLLLCITDIVEIYFSNKKPLTYVDMNYEDYEILKAIHLSTVTTMVLRQMTAQSYFSHQGYIIDAKNATKLRESFKYLLQDPTWNPSSRFVIVIRSLEEDELKKIFDELLARHVVNVLLVNGTNDAHLYTYNPFDNYACGKYYNDVISYGLCSNATHNLFPNKLVTGLRNCTFLATVAHQPPFSINPKLAENHRLTLGAEPYLFQLLGELEHFKVNFSFFDSNGLFTTITRDMKVEGPLAKMTNNETDAMLGMDLLVATRSNAFTYLHGYLDYYDELRFYVKRASYVENWKNLYLEFRPLVWGLLLIVYVMYLTVMIIILRAQDKTNVMLNLLKMFVSSGATIPHQMSSNVRFIFIIWVWFAYLMNSCYQSSLVSLTWTPIKEHQVSNEADLVKYNLKPCIYPGMLKYMRSETNVPNEINKDCLDPLGNLKKVAKSKDSFTLMQQFLYLYNKKMYYDEFGQPTLYYFSKPYVKLIFCIYFYKGFPLSDKMRQNALRLRENGLVYKTFRDLLHARLLKFHFHQKEFESRFVMPWFFYAAGCCSAIVVFVFELLFKQYKKLFGLIVRTYCMFCRPRQGMIP